MRLFHCNYSFIGKREKNKEFEANKKYRFSDKRAKEINDGFNKLYGIKNVLVPLPEPEKELTIKDIVKEDLESGPTS